jgi:hypothetical protein
LQLVANCHQCHRNQVSLRDRLCFSVVTPYFYFRRSKAVQQPQQQQSNAMPPPLQLTNNNDAQNYNDNDFNTFDCNSTNLDDDNTALSTNTTATATTATATTTSALHENHTLNGSDNRTMPIDDCKRKRRICSLFSRFDSHLCLFSIDDTEHIGRPGTHQQHVVRQQSRRHRHPPIIVTNFFSAFAIIVQCELLYFLVATTKPQSFDEQ